MPQSQQRTRYCPEYFITGASWCFAPWSNFFDSRCPRRNGRKSSGITSPVIQARARNRNWPEFCTVAANRIRNCWPNFLRLLRRRDSRSACDLTGNQVDPSIRVTIIDQARKDVPTDVDTLRSAAPNLPLSSPKKSFPESSSLPVHPAANEVSHEQASRGIFISPVKPALQARWESLISASRADTKVQVRKRSRSPVISPFLRQQTDEMTDGKALRGRPHSSTRPALYATSSVLNKAQDMVDLQTEPPPRNVNLDSLPKVHAEPSRANGKNDSEERPDVPKKLTVTTPAEQINWGNQQATCSSSAVSSFTNAQNGQLNGKTAAIGRPLLSPQINSHASWPQINPQARSSRRASVCSNRSDEDEMARKFDDFDDDPDETNMIEVYVQPFASYIGS